MAIQSNQIIHEVALPSTGNPQNTSYTTILSDFDTNFGSPCRLHASFPIADSKLIIEPNTVQKADGTAMTTPPLKKLIASLVLTSIDFQAQTITGGVVNITWPTVTLGQYIRCAFTLKSDGSIDATFSSAAASVAALANAGSLFTSGGIPLGWIDLQCTNASPVRFKTADSATNIIENNIGATSKIFVFGSGGAGGSSVSINTTVQSIPNGGTIAISNLEGDEIVYVTGQGGPITTSSTPFGTSSIPEGKRVTVICMDETNTVSIPYNDTANGMFANIDPAGSLEISKFLPAKFQKLNDRYFGQRGI
ncbi:MAG: hypothetical protein ACXVCY_04645 [Pseudobdellovibrionaceae bacterium]